MQLVQPAHLVSPLDREKPELAGGYCPACDRHMFPVRAVCPHCWGQAQAVSLGSGGELFSYSVVRVAPPGFQAPYAVGYVMLPSGLRVFAQLEGVLDSLDDVRLGDRMRLVVSPIRTAEDGTVVSGPKYRREAKAGE